MGYRRVVSEDGGETSWSPLIRVPANQPLEYEDTRLETGKTYEFVVTATNKWWRGSKSSGVHQESKRSQ